MYFVKSVDTPCFEAESRKVAILQAVARDLEHTILYDGMALLSLLVRLYDLVEVVDSRFSGPEVDIHYYAETKTIQTNLILAPGENSVIFSISVVEVVATLQPNTIPDHISETLSLLDHQVFRAFCQTVGAES